jgi:hypothetical protein
MKKLALFAPTIILAAACSGSAVTLQPGQWETTIRFTSIEAPGMPPAMMAAMRARMGTPQTISQCMTPQQAANPTGNMMNPGGRPNGCQYTENTFSGGTIRVHGSCQQPGAGSVRMTLDGSYTATTMAAQMTQEMHAPPGTPGPQAINVSGPLTARRIGDCPAGH